MHRSIPARRRAALAVLSAFAAVASLMPASASAGAEPSRTPSAVGPAPACTPAQEKQATPNCLLTVPGEASLSSGPAGTPAAADPDYPGKLVRKFQVHGATVGPECTGDGPYIPSPIPCTYRRISVSAAVYAPGAAAPVPLTSAGMDIVTPAFPNCWHVDSCTSGTAFDPTTFDGTKIIIVTVSSVIVTTHELGEGHTIRYGFGLRVNGTRPKPTAGFTFDVRGGAVDFHGTSTDSAGLPLTNEWTFGDGSTGTGVNPTHTYTSPGTYPVTLKSTNTSGLSDSITKDVVIKAPTLAVAVELVGANPPLQPDVAVPVQVTVSASADGVKPIEGIRFAGDVLRSAPAAAFDVTAGPTPAPPSAGFSLEPGARRIFEFTLTARQVGRYTLSSAVTGVDATGTTQSAEASSPGVIGEALSVSIALDPPFAKLTEGPNGPNPLDVTATVTLKNTTNVTMDAVTLTSLRVDRTAPGQLLAVKQVGGVDPGTTGYAVGPLSPGQSIDLIAKFRATDDAEVEFSAQATAHLTDGRNEIGSGKKKWTLRPKYLLDLRTTVTNPAGAALLPAGELIRVAGTVHNLSTTATLELGPLYPQTSGNTGVMSLAWDTTGTDPRDFVPAQGLTLKPGETRRFTVRVLTNYSDPRINDAAVNRSGGVVAKLLFTPWGTATYADGTTENLTADNIRTTEADLAKRVSIDDSISIPTTDPVTLLAAGFVGGAQGLYSGVSSVISQAIDLVKLPYTALVAIGEFQSQVWASFTPAERDAFAADTGLMVAAILMRNAELAKQGSVALFEQAKVVSLKVMTDAANDWAVGDYTQTVQSYSKWTTDQITQIVAPIAFGKLLKAPAAVRAITRAQAAIQERMAPLLARVTKVRKVVEIAPLLAELASGTELTAEQIKLLYGIAPEELAELQRLASKYSFLLTVRSRAVSSLDWIKRGARLKPEILKIKGVSELDAKLGYNAADVGSLVFKKPEPLIRFDNGGGNLDTLISEYVTSRGFTEGTVDYQNAVKRMAERAAEWRDYEQTYKHWSDRGWVDTTFNGKDNAVPSPYLPQRSRLGVAPLASGKYEGFRLFKTGPEEYVVEFLDAKTGRFVRVTGDIDPIAFTHLDGSPLTVAEHARLLTELAANPLLQTQHGESATYVRGGLKFIAKQFKPNEPGLQIAPGGHAPRVVRFDAEHPKSVWNSPDDYHLHFDGGFTYSGSYVPRTAIPRTPVVVPAPMPAPVSVPLPLTQSLDGEPNVGRLKIKFSTAAEAANAYLDVNGKIVNLAGGNGRTSRPSPLQDEAFGDNGKLAREVLVKPVTGLTKPAQVGQTELMIPQGQPWLADAGKGMNVGDTVIVGVGTDHAEAHQIIAFGSIIIDRGLRYAHAAGELIMVTRSRPVAAPAAKPAPVVIPAVTGTASLPAQLGAGVVLVVMGLTLLVGGRRRRRGDRPTIMWR